MDLLKRLHAFIQNNSAVIIVLALAIIAAFLIKANYSYSITDAFSAIADVSMALFALLGLLVAKKWQREATQSKGIDLSISILTESIPLINGLILPIVYIKISESYLLSFKKDTNISFNKCRAFRNGMKGYGDIVSRESKALVKLRTELKHLNVVSWSVTCKYKEKFEQYKKLLTECITKEHELEVHIRTIIANWNLNFTDDDLKAYTEITWNLSDNYNVDEGIKLCNEIVRIKEDIYEHLKTMNIDNLSIFDVFEPKH
ncbi:hypothetical protein WJF69_004572 [Klebsiella aerogenes]